MYGDARHHPSTHEAFEFISLGHITNKFKANLGSIMRAFLRKKKRLSDILVVLRLKNEKVLI